MLNQSTYRSWIYYRAILPAIAGCSLLIASFLPWFIDPTGQCFSAWQLSVDIGWQLRSGIFNYGLLCLGCACASFFVAYMAWRTLQAEITDEPFVAIYPVAKYASIVAIVCLIPSLLFLLQCLFIDMGSIATLTRGELQVYLVKIHFNYSTADQFIPIQPFTFHPLNFSERLALILDQSNIGLFLPLVSTLILLFTRSLQPRKPITAYQTKEGLHRLHIILATIVSLFIAVALGRGPTAFVCIYQAEHLLNTGDYNGVLQWLDVAHLLNPSLDQLAAYHIERGQAWYFLHPQQHNLESQVYLADYYLQQNDLVSSYQELTAVQQKYPHISWVTDEISISIAQLAEVSKPLRGQQIQLMNNDTPALSWLYQLEQIDPQNVYAQYTIGRIFYDIRDYSDCEIQMRSVLALSTVNDVQSSAYTYIALSKIGQGENATGREYLFKAQDLDPAYRNNTARQDISGLR
jgi:hypothetical protein